MSTADREADPRVERSRRVILAATLDELGEVGYGCLTIEAVAARAGVGKATIYRHWSGKVDLVEDAFGELRSVIEAPTEGSLVARVTRLLTDVATYVCASTFSSCMPALIDAAERDPEVRALHRRITSVRRGVLKRLLEEGVEGGELPAGTDVEILTDALVGPIFLRRLLLHEPLDPARVPALVAQVLPRPHP